MYPRHMAGRRLVVVAVSFTVAVSSVALAAAPAGKIPAAAVYRLRPDPRLCPSPMCGGFWAARANRATAICLDGAARASCYVASVDLSALPVRRRAQAQATLPTGRALVTGSFAPYRSPAFPQLARLVASRVWVTTAPGSYTETVYRIVNTGILCVRAPCYSLRATAANSTGSSMLSGLDLTATGAAAARIRRALAAPGAGGVLASGTIRAESKPGTPDAGRTFVAVQVWLPI